MIVSCSYFYIGARKRNGNFLNILNPYRNCILYLERDSYQVLLRKHAVKALSQGGVFVV